MKTPNDFTAEQIKSVNELIGLFTPQATEDLDEKTAKLAGNIAATAIAMSFLPDLEEANKRGEENDDFCIQKFGIYVAEAIIAIAKENIKSFKEENWRKIEEQVDMPEEKIRTIRAFLNSD